MRAATTMAAVLLLLAPPAAATCYEEAAARYSVGADLLRAIALTESRENNAAVHVNTNGSEDVCLMQINSGWLPRLAPFGITRQSLLADSCTCVHVGAWILANEVSQVGYTWRAVARYNVGPDPAREDLGRVYAGRVLQHFRRLTGEGKTP